MQRMLRGETQRRAQRQDHRQVGLRQDRRHDHEVWQREPDAGLEAKQMQCTRRLGMAGDEDEAKLLEPGTVAQRTRQRVAAAQQHHVALLQDGGALGAHQPRQVAEGEVEAAFFERRCNGFWR